MATSCSLGLANAGTLAPVNGAISMKVTNGARSLECHVAPIIAARTSARQGKAGCLLQQHRRQEFSLALTFRTGKSKVTCSAIEGASLGGAHDDGNVKEISSKDDFIKYTTEAGDRLVVLDISTRTCGPCKFIYPKYVEMSREYPDVVFLKIMGDKDESTRALMREWGVRAVPNFRFYRNGELIHKHNGANEDVLRSNFATFYATVAA